MILGIDSSRLKGEITISDKKYYETIKLDWTEDIPLILKEKKISLENLNTMAIAIGPGSFTGLRIGLAIAKGLSYRSNIPVFGIKTFDAMIVNLKDGIYIPLLYAKTDYVYSAIIKKEKNKILRIKKDDVYRIVEVKEWEGIRIGEPIKEIKNVKEDFSISQGLIKIVQMIEEKKYSDYIINPLEPMYLSLAEAEIKRSSLNLKYDKIKTLDLPEIIEIENDSFSAPWDIYSFRYVISHKECYSMKAVIGDTIVGYIIGCFESKKFHLMNLAVRKNSRRKGIGKNLIFKMIKDIEKTDAKEIYLEVRITNEPAINLYKLMGFKIERIERNYYENGEDAVIMSLGIK